MTHQESLNLREDVFRKMGLLKDLWTNDSLWKQDISAGHLPNIESSWEVCAEYLVPFMRERGWNYRITSLWTFAWEPLLGIHGEDAVAHKTEIKNDNIAEAACEAFMEVGL